MKRSRRFLHSCLGLALLAGCGSTGVPEEPHEVENRLIAVRDGALAPADVEVARFGVVGWLNDAGSAGGAIEIVVETGALGTETCSTRLGFEDRGQQTVAAAVAPGQVVSACFHTPGRFAYTVKRGDKSWNGTIAVRGEEEQR